MHADDLAAVDKLEQRRDRQKRDGQVDDRRVLRHRRVQEEPDQKAAGEPERQGRAGPEESAGEQRRPAERKSVVEGKSGSVRVGLGWSSNHKKKKKNKTQ